MRTGYSKSEKMDPRVSQSEAKGTKSEPRDTKSEPKGSQREPKGAKREPNVSQRATKMHPKIDFRTWSRKVWILGAPGYFRIVHFGSHFPSKIDEKNDAKIDA